MCIRDSYSKAPLPEPDTGTAPLRPPPIPIGQIMPAVPSHAVPVHFLDVYKRQGAECKRHCRRCEHNHYEAAQSRLV